MDLQTGPGHRHRSVPSLPSVVHYQLGVHPQTLTSLQLPRPISAFAPQPDCLSLLPASQPGPPGHQHLLEALAKTSVGHFGFGPQPGLALMCSKVTSQSFAGDFMSPRPVMWGESSSSLALLLSHPHRGQTSEELAGCAFGTLNPNLQQGRC